VSIITADNASNNKTIGRVVELITTIVEARITGYSTNTLNDATKRDLGKTKEDFFIRRARLKIGRVLVTEDTGVSRSLVSDEF
jgi:hypothetical protein